MIGDTLTGQVSNPLTIIYYYSAYETLIVTLEIWNSGVLSKK